jgi:hypothetical protein
MVFLSTNFKRIKNLINNKMNNYSKMYWLTRLDELQGLLIFLMVTCFILCLVILIGSLISSDFDEFKSNEEIEVRKGVRQKLRGKVKWIFPLGILFLILKIFIPNKTEAIIIVAGGKTLDYVQKDTSLSKIPYQTTAIISDYLDKTIKELKDKK